MSARSGRPSATSVVLHAALVAGAVVALLPTFWMVSASLMPTGEANSYPPRFVPSRVTLEHYRDLFTREQLARHPLTSLSRRRSSRCA